MTTLILASGSPRRRELLQAMGLTDFEVRVFPIDEAVVAADLVGQRSDLRYLERIVQSKRQAAERGVLHAAAAAMAANAGDSDRTPGAGLASNDTWILVADTTVALHGEILGKPSDVQEARAFLTRLSGQTHIVATRFSLSNLAEAGVRALYEETSETMVAFRSLSVAQIDRYAATGEGLDKAGGYAIQGGAATFVVSIQGSYTNVVGLPAAQVAIALQVHGLGP